ncbi:hypothetical protein [Achromobacter denitrificans]|uniref:hypothetical protein n=1 Tax=Achromobacter denitrificans TaxID=32002 RepID=UPI003BA1E08F
MTTKHTPGPWRYQPGRDSRPPYVIRGSEGGFVVVGMTADRQEADAALIAAAPELLEALEAEEEWRGREDAGELDPEWDYETMVAAKRRAAISKAKGEQQ